MKRLLLTAGFVALVLVIGGMNGLSSIPLVGLAVLGGGFGWLLGGLPSGPGGGRASDGGGGEPSPGGEGEGGGSA